MKIVRLLTAEFIGTTALLAIVVGSGIMAERLAQGNAAVALLANALATGTGLFVLITVLSPVSGAHFNPVVTLMALSRRTLRLRHGMGYLCAQFAGALAGVVIAHAMFGLTLIQTSRHDRDTTGEMLGEIVATAGLLLTIAGSRRHSAPLVAALVGAYITAAYWFTSSTSFANPAVTLARAFTDTFAGIAPASVGGFIAAQLIAVPVALGLQRIFEE
jgi:glycerol uptake facilitator-like aquaporin